MFRRRPLRPLRSIRPVVGRAFAAPQVPPALLRANQLMTAGDYPAAAEAFEMLARGAETRRIPQASHLFLRAGQACLLAGQAAAGMEHLRHGLSMMAESGQWNRLNQAGQRVVSDLQEQGLNKEAQEISEFLKDRLRTTPDGLSTSSPARTLKLPSHCPGCGGPVRVAESEKLDDDTIECPYCGSPIRNE